MIPFIAQMRGISFQEARETTSPREYGEVHRYLQRNPPDEIPKLLAFLITMQCAEPRPVIEEMLPHRYTQEEVEKARAEADDRRIEAKMERVARKMSGGV